MLFNTPTFPIKNSEEGDYLREMISSNRNTITCSLQDLPNPIIETKRGSVERAINLPSVKPGPEEC